MARLNYRGLATGVDASSLCLGDALKVAPFA